MYYQDGLNWIGPEDEAFLKDGLHTGAEGYELLGRRFHDLHEFVFRAVYRVAK
ncbi:hypothetical protein [Paenibacillus medicaginis]|uniref:SGNH hydrolase-type esterase domain-containing protein n=1 Tax=Paenibacillus medicaginis TaxID=1470560 RepID=A0ABV5C158_9BACL